MPATHGRMHDVRVEVHRQREASAPPGCGSTYYASCAARKRQHRLPPPVRGAPPQSGRRLVGGGQLAHVVHQHLPAAGSAVLIRGCALGKRIGRRLPSSLAMDCLETAPGPSP